MSPRPWKDFEAEKRLTRPYAEVKANRICLRLACDNSLPPRRQHWCSDECAKHIAELTVFSSARTALFRREQGVCRMCGLNTVHVVQLLKDAYSMFSKEQGTDAATDLMWKIHAEVGATAPGVAYWGPSFYNCPDLWHADHIIPLAEGGSLCDPDNLRSLCVWCHKKETAALAARLAKAKRVSKKHTIGYVPLRFQQ